jgi:hypothetical protein
MTAAIEFERDRRYRLRWWTLAVLSVSLLIIIADDTAAPGVARAQDRPRQGRVPNVANEPERKWYR